MTKTDDKDNMRVVFEKGDNNNIKKIMLDRLSAMDIKIEDEYVDIVVVELPDNKENDAINWIEKDIYVWLSGLSIEDEIKGFMEKPYKEMEPEGLCKSIEQILIQNGNKEVFYDMESLKNATNPGSAKKYHLLVIIGLKESISGYAELAKYIVKNIEEKLEYTGDFLKMNKKKLGKRQLFDDFQKKWILLGNFAEYYMGKSELPSPEVLTKLSATRYEGSESEARIYFTKNAIDTIEEFSAEGEGDRVINEQNLRMIRKLMEISKRNTLHLYAERGGEEKGGEIKHTISCLVQHREEQEDTYVKFLGFMNWSLFEKEREVFNYYHGEYRFNVSKEQYAYLDVINNLKSVDTEMIRKLVEILRRQKHGAAAVLFDQETDAVTEVNRLCRVKRGIKICSNICYDKETGWNEEQILSVTGIDGALFIDYEGRCLAIGVIVDGQIKIEGNAGRGARYNSIENYMGLNPNCVGIVISEDGMVDVIQNPENPAASNSEKK